MQEIAVDFIYYYLFNVIIACCEDIYGRFCMKKVTMITSTHNLPSSSLT